MPNFRNLHVWKKSHDLALSIHALTPHLLRSRFPPVFVERIGSANEIDAQLLLGKDLGFLPGEVHSRLGKQLSEARKMLIGLIQTLKRPGAES